MHLQWRWLLLTLALLLAVQARPANESITYEKHPFPSLGPYFRLPIHPVAQNGTRMEQLQFNYDYFRQAGRHDDLINNGQERHNFQRVMQTMFGTQRRSHADYWKSASQCDNADAAFFPTELSAEPEDRLAALYGMMQTNCRDSREMRAIDYFRAIHKGSHSPHRVFPRTDPSRTMRCTMCMDDDGMCGAVVGGDDDDDDVFNPCTDDDDGLPNEDSQQPQQGEGASPLGGNGRCCGVKENGRSVCKGSTLSFDDDADDWDDEETNFHRTDYGNECDDDDGDDDDGKQTYSYVDNTMGIENVADFYRIQQQMRNAHEATSGVVNFVNQVWLCTFNPTVPVPFSLAVSVPIQGFNETQVPGSNITIFMLDDTLATFVYNDTIDVQPCASENNVTATYSFTATVNTTILVTQMVYDNLTMSTVSVQVPMPMQIVVPVVLNVTATIPDPALYPQVDLAAEALDLSQYALVADPDLIADHLAENVNNPELGLPGGVFDNWPFERFGYSGGSRSFNLEGLLPMLDLISFGPYYFSDQNVPGSCKTCQRMCGVLDFMQRLQVVRARNATRFFVNPAIHEEREVRLLNSHRTYHGDFLCEMKDMMDWLQCFSKTVQFPQLERVLSCMELHFFGAQNNENALPFVNIDTLISYGRDFIREIEVWYAERGYYTNATIANGCIDPDIVSWAQNCMPQDIRARILTENPRFRIDASGNKTHPYDVEFDGLCLFDSDTTAYGGTAGQGDYGTDNRFHKVRPIEFRGSKCMPSQGNTRERHIRDCRASAMAQIMKKFRDAITSVRTLTIAMDRRVDLMANYLRRARENYPLEYMFPAVDTKCFAQENTAFAELTPAGNITHALQMLQQQLDLTPLQVLPAI